MQYETIPVARISNSSILLFNTYTTPPRRSEKQRRAEINLSRGQYNGYMSPKTKSKVHRYLSTWLEAVARIKESGNGHKLDKNPYITFVTLTLPASQQHSDIEIKRKCLTPFIENIKRNHNVWNYFWRAESQANGSIHFHIIIDSYINHKALRDLWNKSVSKLGYIDRFSTKHGHSDPNSTDIHKIVHLKSLEAYVIKYCCKEDGYRPIDGRIHGCSDDLKTLTPYEQLIDNQMIELIDIAIDSVSSKVIEGEGYTIIICNTKELIKTSGTKIGKHISKYYHRVATDLYNITINEIEEIISPSPKKAVYKQSELKFYYNSDNANKNQKP